MEQKPIDLNRHLGNSSTNYKAYSRPLLGRLLEAMELAKHYYHGEGDYLYYVQEGLIHRVLDFTGGYGANILGHRHPQLLEKIQQWHDQGTPSLTQGSFRNESGELAKKISDILVKETAEGPWITTFSNSGTESIEAAIKHCLIYYKYKLVETLQEIDKEINEALIHITRQKPEEILNHLMRLRSQLVNKTSELKMSEERKSYLIHQISNTHSLYELVCLIREVNSLQIKLHPKIVALEKSFHGKTLGSLAITFNQGFREDFYLSEEYNTNTIFISQYIDALELTKIIEDSKLDLIMIALNRNEVTLAKHSFSTIAGVFIEPIQGEAGVVPVSFDLLAQLKKHCIQEDILLVFDEIQAGMFRTGTLSSGSASDITADIYTFSKSLGGGVAKIAATTVIQKKYNEDFGFLHTSTFSDDGLSSTIALEVLNIMTAENSPLPMAMENAQYLQARLSALKEQFPQVFSEIRGRGLMLAIEFHDLLVKFGLEFKIISDAKMQGYLMSSALLNHESIRMTPSLSNNLTLRVQPSLYITTTQIDQLILGLTNLAQALIKKDITYFLSAIYPGEQINPTPTPGFQTNLEPHKRPLSVFLCHLIDEAHIKNVSCALKDVSGKNLLQKLAKTKDISEFELYHTQTIRDLRGNSMDIALLAIPVTSEELKKSFISRKRYQIIKKVQNALDYAKSLGATTVGLGQFTSIVSGNGLYLDARGMNLTTGNGYTIALTVESALRSAKEKNIDLSKATVAIIGAAGNIMSVASSLMADHVGKLILIHHTPIETSLKFKEATKRILNEISQSEMSSTITQTIRSEWNTNSDLTSFLASPKIKDVFETAGDISSLKDADIVLCGASASSGFIDPSIFKKNAVIVDVAVPPTIKEELLNQIEVQRPDLTYHLGGVANLPHNQSINFFVFPLKAGECYACMAETFAIGLSGQRNFLNIGDLNKNIVNQVQKLAQDAGFSLGKTKDKSSL